MPPLLRLAGGKLLTGAPKQICLSGPTGFLGSRVLNSILDAHELRAQHGLEPGEVILLSSSPGRLMQRLSQQYGPDKMKTIRATRVDYYNQLEVRAWHDQLGSLGLGGPNSVFVNLAALAGPQGHPDQRKRRIQSGSDTNPMQHVNYLAPIAAAEACEQLGFGHWIQSSTQATKAERAGQVPYSRWKAMCDFNLKRMDELPVTILTIGLLYCKHSKVAGQSSDMLNMMDLALLPLTPIMGNGSAPLQPLELNDAAERMAFLALTETADRPLQKNNCCALPEERKHKIPDERKKAIRVYDAVGPETLSITELLQKFAEHNNTTFRPVQVNYRNMERIMNIASLGNLNRQFISLLRSEQACNQPIIGDHEVFERLLGEEARLIRIDEGLRAHNCSETVDDTVYTKMSPRKFPYGAVVKWIAKNPGVIWPGIALTGEILLNAALGVTPSAFKKPTSAEEFDSKKARA